MNNQLLNKEVQQFIIENLDKDLNKIILSGSPFPNISVQELAEQIIGRKQIEYKLPTFFKTDEILFPKKLNLEQSSSEITGRFKSQIIDGQSIVDLTGGFGIDSYYFAKTFDHVIYCEQNKTLCDISRHNFEVLGIKNIICQCADSIEWLSSHSEKFDWIYLDPARRDLEQRKVFLLEDCTPDILKNLDLLFSRTDHILLKLSPMIDISSVVYKIPFVKHLFVVAIKNEVKELLVIIEKYFDREIELSTINFSKETEIFKSKYPDIPQTTVTPTKKYLYEPNSAILKSGLFNSLSNKLNLSKLHTNTHLYTSDEIINFPGRCFEIISQSKVNKKEIKKQIPLLKANVAIRNFPGTVFDLRKKFKLRDGGTDYLFFTTNLNEEHIVLYCKKISPNQD
ncbi:class I SAM-dependent methyltransferase [Namhaeicola litoreus]|uniref:Class I SAM-dependent methyltransferase n=1 Tax=Namhaeicola litoreus TaxID=1052145 RepID=A0ABW3Y261_9FLAO